MFAVTISVLSMVKAIIITEVAKAVAKYPEKTVLQALREYAGLGRGWAIRGYWMNLYKGRISCLSRKTGESVSMSFKEAAKDYEASLKPGEQGVLF